MWTGQVIEMESGHRGREATGLGVRLVGSMSKVTFKTWEAAEALAHNLTKGNSKKRTSKISWADDSRISMTKFRLSLVFWLFPTLSNVGSEDEPETSWRLTKCQGNVQLLPAGGSTATHREQSEKPFPTTKKNRKPQPKGETFGWLICAFWSDWCGQFVISKFCYSYNRFSCQDVTLTLQIASYSSIFLWFIWATYIQTIASSVFCVSGGFFPSLHGMILGNVLSSFWVVCRI